jgi:hypothetical protein
MLINYDLKLFSGVLHCTHKKSLSWGQISILLFKEFNIFVASNLSLCLIGILSTYRIVLCCRTKQFITPRWGEWRDEMLLTDFLKWMQRTQSWSYTKDRDSDNIHWSVYRKSCNRREEHWQNNEWHENPGLPRVKPVTEPPILPPQAPHRLPWI